MQIRRFSADLKVKLRSGQGVFGVPIQMDSAQIPAGSLEALSQRVHGVPILLNGPTQVEAMYFESHATIDEHSAPNPALFLLTGGKGFVRIGGSAGETRPIEVGDAVLWPAGLDHIVWTEDEPLQAIVINLPTEREA